MTPKSPRAVILGGTGAVGTATALRLARAGWSVTVTGLSPARVPQELAPHGVHAVMADRTDGHALHELLDPGADLLVDCACFTAAQARSLLPYLADVGSAVMLSSKAVYADAEGRHVNSDDPPCFPNPVTEQQTTVHPSSNLPYDSRDGYGANKAAAEEVLLASGHPVSVLRLSKVHGPWSRRPREWVFLKRCLDRRPAVFLAHRGEGVDHPTAAANAAALIEASAQRPGSRVVNCADPDAPDARSIARAVAAWAGHSWEEVLVDGRPSDGVGAHPWDAVPPIVLDTTAAIALGHRPVGDYRSTVADELAWLAGLASRPALGPLLPAADDPFFSRFLRYGPEDAFLADRPR